MLYRSFSLCRSLSVSCTNHYNDGRRAKRIGPLNHVPNVMLFFLTYAIFVFILNFFYCIFTTFEIKIPTVFNNQMNKNPATATMAKKEQTNKQTNKKLSIYARLLNSTYEIVQ
jgi:hypothetical protein